MTGCGLVPQPVRVRAPRRKPHNAAPAQGSGRRDGESPLQSLHSQGGIAPRPSSDTRPSCTDNGRARGALGTPQTPRSGHPATPKTLIFQNKGPAQLHPTTRPTTPSPAAYSAPPRWTASAAFSSALAMYQTSSARSDEPPVARNQDRAASRRRCSPSARRARHSA